MKIIKTISNAIASIIFIPVLIIMASLYILITDERDKLFENYKGSENNGNL